MSKAKALTTAPKPGAVDRAHAALFELAQATTDWRHRAAAFEATGNTRHSDWLQGQAKLVDSARDAIREGLLQPTLELAPPPPVLPPAEKVEP